MQFNIVFQDWLRANKIAPTIVEGFGITCNANSGDIIFPVHDIDGHFIFNKYRRNPLSSIGPKYRYDIGGRVTLYGYYKAKDHDTILICEGEKDCLVAWSHNIPAITSTGGALSFQKDWAPLLKDKNVVILLDNDHTGGLGVVRILSLVPHAKVCFIPEIATIKDISDYVNAGKDLHQLLKTAKHFESVEDVVEDQRTKHARFESNTHFHDEYIKAHTKVAPAKGTVPFTSFASDRITRAKDYPIPNLLDFVGLKARCPFHNEATPSLHYYTKTNSCYCFGGCGRAYDAIDIYMHQHSISFSEAVKIINDML